MFKTSLFNVIIFFMRILCFNFSHRIKNKIERQVDTIFGLMFFIMLWGTNCNYNFYINFIKVSTNHFIGYKKPYKHYKSKYYSLWIYYNGEISFPAYFSRFVRFHMRNYNAKKCVYQNVSFFFKISFYWWF